MDKAFETNVNLAGLFMIIPKDQWRAMKTCPKDCEHFKEVSSKGLCNHNWHVINMGKARLSQRLQVLFLFCPLGVKNKPEYQQKCIEIVEKL